MIPMVVGVEGKDQQGTPVPTIGIAADSVVVDLVVLVVVAHVIVVVSLATMMAARQRRSKRQ